MMLPETLTASSLVVCLATFFSVNLQNVAKSHPGRKSVKVYAEVRRPKSFTLTLAALGTVLLFLESILYSFLVFTGISSTLNIFPLQLRFQHDSYVQLAGIVLNGAGYLLFIWSVFARSKYAFSWEMAENHRLVTWGPYRYVRHPSYLGYFLMFLGLLIWLNLVAILPWVAVPSYARITVGEKELLIRRFREKYIRYQKKTGRFFPRRSRIEE